MQAEINLANCYYITIITLIIISLLMKKYNIKKRIWTRKWIEMRPNNGAYNKLMQELENEDTPSLNNFLRMDKASFDKIANLKEPLIKKKNTRFRNAISVKERLAITLRFLATGILLNFVKMIQLFIDNKF